jgi:dCMP deaminase
MKYYKLQNYMKQAEVIAKNSPDTQKQVGAVLVKIDGGEVIAQGYNGYVRNTMTALPTTRPKKYEYMIHAEENVILNCARNGISTKDCYLVCTLSPCKSCMRRMKQAGISTIYFKEKYKDFEDQLTMKDLQIELTQVKDYYRIKLEVK